MREVRRLRPQEQQANVDLINRLSWSAELEFHSGRTQAAFAYWNEALDEARQLVAMDPENRDSRDMLGSILFSKGRSMVSVNPSEADTSLSEAETIFRNLSLFDPSNERWRRLSSDLTQQRRQLTSQ